ncbi:mammalian cell entry protein [Mycolicibacterium novocastrense]|uniref:MCE family protein n=1 Tax=Mycolicibacterium novocastrense TaxID=59813 RepID=UPI00074B1D04|nr:MlaD family protein [Mycolicibacterium novocastrense]KUH69799.1 mammalian cell entry protein [Mycolicibacterium novocastrense]KUH71348.1 mammalian cell entry protein [Mycolicibacterium novocastrense]KUH74412.1 mammalian cell entry protein [Mycolicibacterium novocastrense]
MHLNRRVQLQLAFFAVITLVAGSAMALVYLRLPSLWFGVGTYHVTMQLPNSAGLYANSNVTYRGTEVGRVDAVQLSPSGVQASLVLRSDIKVPADLDAQVRSQTAAGELFVELLPRGAGGPNLVDGSVIPADRTQIPTDINTLLAATNNGLQAIPHDNLKTVIDESYTAVGGLGPELSRIVRSSTALAIDARDNLDALTTLIDKSQPVLSTQIDTSDSIQAWASHTANIANQLEEHDDAIRGVLSEGPAAADELRQMFDELRPTVPILAANLVSLADVAVVYQANLEQILVMLPPGIEMVQGAQLANRDNKDHKGFYLSFNLNANLPPPCTTGFLPPQQIRPPSEVDYPARPAGDIYCRIPQDSMFNVRGARNLPCVTRPGKRAPTVEMCERDEQYVPLNDGLNWKGDPNATLSGQAVPQQRSGTEPASSSATVEPQPPSTPIATATYDPATGQYIGPDGKLYSQTNLAPGGQPKRWQDLLLPQEHGNP